MQQKNPKKQPNKKAPDLVEMQESPDQTTLTPRQHKALIALSEGAKQTDAAAAVGVDRSTIRRWLSQPLFAGELHSAMNAVHRSGAMRIASLHDDAVDTLARLLKPDMPATVQLNAARTILETSMAAWERYGLSVDLFTEEEEEEEDDHGDL